MKIFPANMVRELDLATCESQKISSLELMERAANAVTCEIISRFLPGQRIIVFAGPGNNGGDALAVARMLYEQGYRKIEVFLFNVLSKLSPNCETERDELLALGGVDFTEVKRDFSLPYIDEKDVVVDGLFGSGLHRAMQGGFVVLSRRINESGAYVVSIDLPSGLFGEWNENVSKRDMIHADLTLTFQTPKLAFLFEENEPVVGEWKVLDIDLDEKAIRETPADFTLVEAGSVRPILRPRPKFSGKRDYGSALIMAGSIGMMGAAVMSAKACFKSGAGLVTVHSARVGIPVLQTAVPEVMFEPDRNENIITDMTLHHDHQVVAVGPGIGTGDRTIDALEQLLKTCKSRLVLDADALNCIAKRPSRLELLPANTSITPHIGEFDRLFGVHPNSEERLKKAIDMAKYYNIVIVLKGHYTATVRPNGKVYFNSTGNPGMATAGAGDVLTGVISAFLSQGYSPEHAAIVGVFIHGLAGDMAAAEYGECGMSATDIISYCGRAIKAIINREKIS